MATPKLGRLRLANPNDAADIYELINESMMKNFRVYQIYDVNFMIEYSTIAIVQLDDKEEIVGFLAAKDHLNIPSVHPSAWEHYIWTKYKAIEMTARNTLFIHLLCFDKTFGRDTVDSLLRSLFMHDSYLLYIAMVKSTTKYPLLIPGQSRMEASFKRIAASERGVPPELLPTLCVAERSEVCPRLRVRRAVEEDNDDLVPIIDQHSTRLQEMYGEFYISELISRHPESERVLLVGERAELAVAVMILNTVINYEALEENFDLSPFAGLRKLKGKPVSLVSQGSLQDASASAETFEGDAKKSESDKPDNPVIIKSDFKKTLNWFSNFLESQSTTSNDVLLSMPMALDEDDDVEFDIVNIEQDLLRIPRPLSVELNIVFDMSDETLHLSNVLVEEVADDNPQTAPQHHRKKVVTADKNGPPEFLRYKGLPNAFLLEVLAMHPDYDERHGIDILQAAFEMFPDRDYCVLCLPSKSPAFPLLEHFTLVAPRGVREKYTNQSLYVAHKNSILEHVAVRPAEAFDFPAISQILEHVSDKQNILQLLEKSLVSDVLYSYVLLSQQQPVGVVLLGINQKVESRCSVLPAGLKHVSDKQNILHLQEKYLVSNVLHGYILLSSRPSEYVVLLGSLDNCVGVRTQYRLEPEPRSPGTDGAIIAGVLSPALEPHARFYLRDIIRHSKYYNLFWPCYMTSTAGFSSRNMMSLAGRMCPVTPHRANAPNLTGIAQLDKVWTAPATFPLWMIDERLSALPKVDVNNGIVVVGASRTGLAFIETLLMGPPSQYLTFTNITLVSEYGLPMISDGLPAAETCVPRNGRFTERYLKSIPFLHYVDCIAGTMVGINRKLKYIHLRRGEVKYYDHLVLTCGEQFQHPNYLKESFADSEKMRKGKPCKRILMDNPKYMPDSVPPRPELPENVFIINSLYEANICLRSLMSMIKARRESPDPLSPANPILVYGDYLESYSTMAALIELRISPRDIVFVEPFPPTDDHAMRVNCFNDELIDNRAQIRLKKLGIHVYRKCRYVSWTKLAGRIIAVQVMAPLHKISIPCFALFYYGLKAMNYFAFKAICESGLVYDGGLVIDPMFKTNDPHVYGAGTIIQYSRKLRAEQKLHRDCCSEDVGEALGNIFLRQMDPFVMGDKEADVSELLPRYRSSLLNILPHPSIEAFTKPSLERNRKWQTVLEFDSPVTHSTVLPGPLYYMHVRAPGINLPMEVRLSLDQKGHTMTTDKDSNYFEIRLNEFHTICSITCLSKKPPCYEVLIQLYGVHEAMFNKLLSRYLLNKIPDFYEYFKQPWMSAMTHSSFGIMLREICRQNVGTIFDLVKSHFALDVREDINCEDDLDEWEMISRIISASTIHTRYSEMSSMLYGPGDAPRLGSVHSVIEKFLQLGILYMKEEENKDLTTDECGICEFLQWDAMAFWNALSGDRIVTAHLARYLDRNFLPNPHYAKIRPELI